MTVPAAPAVAAAGAAVALYVWSRRVGLCGTQSPEGLQKSERRHFMRTHQAPNNWVEALYFFAEALRYMYVETLGKWRSADLLIGLAYLARKDGAEHPVADIARHGVLAGVGLSPPQRLTLVDELRTFQRYMRYCLALRERRLAARLEVFKSLGILETDIYVQVPRAGILRPSYVLLRDTQLRTVVLAVRGTHSLKDMFTSLTGASRPHHMLDADGVVLGFSHFGMLAAARWIRERTAPDLKQALAANPGYSLKIIGHSLGGGTAAMLTMMLRDMAPEFAEATCLAIACPACMTVELARSCAPYITTIVNGADVVPTISPGAADALREEVMASSWYEAFRRDMRASLLVRTVEAGLGRVSSATAAASSWTSHHLFSASTKLSACYQRPRGKRRNSGELAWWEPASTCTGPRRTAHAVSSSPGAGAAPEGAGASGRIEIASEWAARRQSMEGGTSSATWANVFQSFKAWGWTTDVPAARSSASGPLSPVLATGSRASFLGSKGPAAAISRDKAAADREKAAEAASRMKAERARATSGTADASSSGTQAGGWAEGMVSWGARSLETTRTVSQRVSLTSQAAYRRAGELLSASWHQKRGPSTPANPGAAAAAAAAAPASPAGPGPSASSPQCSPSPQGMQEEGGSESGWEEGGAWERYGGAASGSQLDREMQAVEAAVAAAEMESEDNLPLSFPPSGGVAPETPGGRVKSAEEVAEEERRRRMTYPAGRILHLVPARLVLGEDAPDLMGASQEERVWREEGGAGADPFFLPYDSYLMDHDGSLVVMGGGPPWAQQPQQPAPPEKCLLLENVPQEAYGRIKVGRRMLQDHFMPSYLAAMDSAIDAILADGQESGPDTSLAVEGQP